MFYLVDTNILLRFVNRHDPQHPIVRTATRKLKGDDHQLRTTSQNFVEFWNVTTRPTDKNGLGLTPSQAHRSLDLLEKLFPLLPDKPDLYGEWRKIVVKFGISGVQVHDARLVAAMITNNVTHILTFNTKDFARYSSSGITTVHPTIFQR
jgi:predicted nucleic acid-binding protein